VDFFYLKKGEHEMRNTLILAVLLSLNISLTGCATLTNDAMTSVAFSVSSGENATCKFENKRGVWTANIPSTVSIRRSDDVLKYDCETTDGCKASGAIESTIGAKIVASAVFLDFGIVDAITDKHREYPASFVIPMAKCH
jgi:hypothetical protein